MSKTAALNVSVSKLQDKVMPATWLQRQRIAPGPPSWTGASLGGCLAELSSAGAAPSLTLAFRLVRERQQQGEPVAWITQTGSTFFPPDVADGGVDVAVLPVIRVSDVTESVRVADQLTRSGAFGLVVIDLGECLDLPIAVQIRLAEHALTHGTLILCLTLKTDRQPSLGSLVSVRGQSRRARLGMGRFACQVHVLKDKRRGPGWVDEEWCRGPDGLC